ncbi:PAAR domain-containing protein [Trinickia terrae]|uniref:PAAR domain-containing protein n=1 Tax=Trinickia terrae TaxID=2571161 RepID=A0A4U1HTW2_9BURK|nr:PAAR domain-containing protein [Trinickia terrae]
MATRYFIRKGDKTTVGGTVLSGAATMGGFGADIAHEGDPVSCPACHSTGVIMAVGSRLPLTGTNSRRIALSGDVCSCRCYPPPELIESQTFMQTTVDDSPASRFSLAGGTTSAPAGSATASAAYSATSSSASTSLANAAPFSLDRAAAESAPNANTLAASGISEEDEAECFNQYEADMAQCKALRSAMGGSRWMDMCSQKAFTRYQQCRGY